MNRSRALRIAVCLTLATSLGVAEERFPPGFLDGDYVLIGREPGGGTTYAGRARIVSGKGGLTLQRRPDGGAVETLRGGFEAAAAGDARVLRWRSVGKRARTITCLVASDLDNYGRLSCVWAYDAESDPSEPGLETLFATDAWPDGAPHKSFDAGAQHR